MPPAFYYEEIGVCNAALYAVFPEDEEEFLWKKILLYSF